MAQRMVIFDVDSLVQLLTHYTEGAIALDAKVREVGFSPLLKHYIGIELESSQWRDAETRPYQFRYQGKKTLCWSNPGQELRWDERE